MPSLVGDRRSRERVRMFGRPRANAINLGEIASSIASKINIHLNITITVTKTRSGYFLLQPNYKENRDQLNVFLTENYIDFQHVNEVFHLSFLSANKLNELFDELLPTTRQSSAC